MAFAFLLSMPGAPFIYYGDEIGLRYVDGLDSVEGGFHRTGSRSPMQWDKSVNAGFSTARPDKLYIPLDSAKDRPDAESQMADEHSLYAQVKKLIAFRGEHPALHNTSAVRFLDVAGEYPLVYERSCEEEKILVVINPSATACDVQADVPVEDVIYTVGGKASVSGSTVHVDGATAAFVKVK